jgi:hypothetical protein
MKKLSTAAARQIRNASEQRLTIGLDLGDRWAIDRTGIAWGRSRQGCAGTTAKHNAEGHARGVRCHATQPDRSGKPVA